MNEEIILNEEEARKLIIQLQKSLLIGKALKEQAGEKAFEDIENQEKCQIEFIKHFLKNKSNCCDIK